MTWEKLENASVEELVDWAQSQAWCQAMANCGQDADWHAEGDVWTHTKMVMRQLSRLDSWDQLSGHDQKLLKFTALFHDAAKPQTTKIDEESGHVISPHHAVKGEHLARQILRQINCNLSTREQITKLVRYHGRPAFLMQRDQPDHEVVRLSWLLKNQLLHLFAVADTRGRSTHSTTRPEENLRYWQLQSEELNCYQQPYPFGNASARFQFFRSRSPNLYYTPHENFSCRVTMMAGLPGSGKDTWLACHCPGMPVVSLDSIRQQLKVLPTDNQGRVIQMAKEQCRRYLRSGTSFAFNATNILRQTRAQWIALFADYHAEIAMVYLEPPWNDILKQNRSRAAAVPQNVIVKLAEKCEPPTWLEAHQVTYADNPNTGTTS